jgi:hypothetical protein
VKLLAALLLSGILQAQIIISGGGGGGGGGGGTPGGSNTQCQYNNSGAFGGITGCTSNGTTITLTSPKITTILDGNGNPFLLSSATASAVDSITVTNAATANPGRVALGVTGSDSNIGLMILSKGSGKIGFGPTSFVPSIGTVDVYDATLSTGITNLSLRAGAAQVSGQISLMNLVSGTGATNYGNVGVIISSSSVVLESMSGDVILSSGGTGLARADHNNGGIAFGNFPAGFGATVAGAQDVCLKRVSAGIVKVDDCSGTVATMRAIYQSSDGSAGVTGASCTAWKNGLCTAP